ncbi:MAG: hypothetical protein LBL50_00470 [Candidatus Margulisbacteria bacterium]|jgi:hypothetical protein|nr:hypothetical protein [Candidatus Margulisiibacteriota bacterium]
MNKIRFWLLAVVLAGGVFARPVAGGGTPNIVTQLETANSDMLDVAFARFVTEKETTIFYELSVGLKPLKLRADLAQVDYRPDLVVAYHSRLSWLDFPVYYAPTLVFDSRPNAYSIPTPLPEFGVSAFRGAYWRWNAHYFLRENLYGNLQFGRAEEKGAGYGFQQIVRLSDAAQLTYINQNWQYWPTQETFSWEYSFLEIPSFNARYANRIRNEFNSLRVTRINYEEYNDDLLLREFELSYIGNFKLDWQKISFYTSNSYASLNELTSAQAGYRWASLSELHREYAVPYLGEIRPGAGYDTVKYSLHPYSWHRVYSYIEGRKKFWLWTGDLRVTDYIDQRGGSPFNYDREEAYDDNVRTTALLNLWRIDLGQTVQYSVYRGSIQAMIYFLRCKTEHWFIDFSYNRLKEEFAVSGQMIGF